MSSSHFEKLMTKYDNEGNRDINTTERTGRYFSLFGCFLTVWRLSIATECTVKVLMSVSQGNHVHNPASVVLLNGKSEVCIRSK